MPFLAIAGKNDDTADNPKPVAAAADPSTSQATTPAVAKATPRKVVMSRPDPFVLEASALKTLQSAYGCHKETQKALLENAARAVKLKISGPFTWPDDATQLMAPFSNVRSLSIEGLSLDDLPLLPCPEKLESLRIRESFFQTIQSITHYTNLHTLQIFDASLNVTEQDPNRTERLAVLTQLHNLRTLDCCDLFTSNRSAPENRALLVQILDNNPGIEKFACVGSLDTEVVRALANLPCRRLEVLCGDIDDEKFALLPFGTLEELRLHGRDHLTSLEPLRNSALRVLGLYNEENLGDTQVICSMPNLAELVLNHCRLTDEQAEPLLQLSQKLRQLNLDSRHPRLLPEMCQRLEEGLSPEMCQRLEEAFGDKVSIEVIP